MLGSEREGSTKAVAKRGRHPIVLYLTVAFAMAWSVWLVAWLINQRELSLPLFPVLVAGSFGPFIGALVTILAEGGTRQALRFFARAFDPKMGWGPFLVSFFLLPVLAVAVEIVHARLAHVVPHFNMTLAELPLTYLLVFVLGGTLAEEYGWSFLSDRLDGVLPLRAATLVLGLIWAFWHLPLFFIIAPGAIQGYTPFYLFVIATVAMRFLFAWAYHTSGYNILSNMLLHTAANMSFSVVPLAPSPADMSTGRMWMFAALTIVTAVLLWVVAPPRPHSPPPEASI